MPSINLPPIEDLDVDDLAHEVVEAAQHVRTVGVAEADAAQLCRRLPHEAGVVAIPVSAFSTRTGISTRTSPYAPAPPYSPPTVVDAPPLKSMSDVVADCLGCAPGEVVFTGSGTEANNLALFGMVDTDRRAHVCGHFGSGA